MLASGHELALRDHARSGEGTVIGVDETGSAPAWIQQHRFRMLHTENGAARREPASAVAADEHEQRGRAARCMSAAYARAPRPDCPDGMNLSAASTNSGGVSSAPNERARTS